MPQSLSIFDIISVKMVNKIFLLLLSVAFGNVAIAQSLTAEQILNKSLKYHDPKGDWKNFNRQLNFVSERPSGADRKSTVFINNNKGLFELKEEDNNMGIVMDSCFLIPSGKTCDQVKRTRNYYVYLWGLPMKLKDEGTILDPKVKEEIFEGVDCYLLRVPYEEDIWFFYIDKATFAMKAYLFLKDEPLREGELIYLDDEEKIGNMRLPKRRKWVTMPEQKVLGTDILTSSK